MNAKFLTELIETYEKCLTGTKGDVRRLEDEILHLETCIENMHKQIEDNMESIGKLKSDAQSYQFLEYHTKVIAKGLGLEGYEDLEQPDFEMPLFDDLKKTLESSSPMRKKSKHFFLDDLEAEDDASEVGDRIRASLGLEGKFERGC